MQNIDFKIPYKFNKKNTVIYTNTEIAIDWPLSGLNPPGSGTRVVNARVIKPSWTF